MKTLMALVIAQTLIELTGPDNQLVEINPSEIVSMRVPRTGTDHFASGTHCIIFTSDGKYTLVQETCRVVVGKMKGN